MASGDVDFDDRAVASQNPNAPNFLRIDEAHEDFLLSRQAMLVSKATLCFYRKTSAKFVRWLTEKGIENLVQITSRHVRAYLNEYAEAGRKPNYINCHARAIKTFLRFCVEEKYLPEMVKFAMPPLSNERLPYLDEKELRTVVEACVSTRAKAMVVFFVDTGVRLTEFIMMDWGDVDLQAGLALVKRGKGGKSRTVVMGARCRRLLMAYRRTVDHDETDPLFQTDEGHRFADMGIRSFFTRLSAKSGVKVSPHALRRTFATLALRAGMNPLHLRGLLGHTTLEMTMRYVQMIDDDLQTAHHRYGPVDHFLK